MPGNAVQQRINDTITARAQRRLLEAMCRAAPDWVTSDMLTLLGVAGAAAAFGGFALSHNSPAWLLVTAAGVLINWLGDSLDESLARYRRAERPKYGFFLNHMTDTVIIGLSMPASSLMTCTSTSRRGSVRSAPRASSPTPSATR
jgi:hypothetical protein